MGACEGKGGNPFWGFCCHVVAVRIIFVAMALLTKKEFADECGMTTRKLAVYIGRDKVLADENGLIDDGNIVNSEFRKIYADKKQAPGKTKGVARATKKTGNVAKDAALEAAETKKGVQNDELYELNKKQKAAQIAREEREALILQARIQKMNGELIPTDLVKALFSSHFREVTLSFKQGIDFILTQIGQETKTNGHQVELWRKKMVAILNESVNKGVENSKKNVANVVTEYQTAKKVA